MPNAFAYLMLYSWPLVAIVLFQRLPIPKALVVTILTGYLLLPEIVGIDLPLLPPVSKTLVPSLSAAVLCLIMARGQERGADRGAGQKPLRRPGLAGAATAPDPGTGAGASSGPAFIRTRRGWLIFGALFVLLFATPFLTVSTNPEPIVVGPRFIPGLRPYDAASILMEITLAFLPFLLARRFLARPEDHVFLMRGLVVSAGLYAILALYEVRMSPQLNSMVYGFFPHSFLQHIRAGGFRPLVFMNHGLWLGIYLGMAVLAACVLFRWSRRDKAAAGRAHLWLLAWVWLIFTLVLAKTVGALVMTLALLPMLFLLGVQGQLLLAMVVAGITLFYPILRGAGWVPVEAAHELALSYSAERAESLKFRFDNEDLLLERAAEKPLAGWGGYGRPLLYEPYQGKLVTITDGAWIIIIGIYGWMGYIAHFGLLCAPLLLLGLRRKRLGITLETAGLALILSLNLMDLLPNGTLTPVTYMIAGALAGRYALEPAARPEPAPGSAPGSPSGSTRPQGPAPGRRSGAAWPGPVLPGPILAKPVPPGSAAGGTGAASPARHQRKPRQPRPQG